MAQISCFEEMPVWQEARALVNQVYNITNQGSFGKDFQFIDHLRRTAISIPSNIAEGFERDGNKEFINFLSIAKGSCGEFRCQLYIALDQNYINQKQFNEIHQKLIDVTKSINNLMRYLKNSDFKGRKFK